MSPLLASFRSATGLALALAGGLVECLALLRARLRWGRDLRGRGL